VQKRTNLLLITVIVLAAVLAGMQPRTNVAAQAGSASGLIDAVNVYRGQFGLAGYSVDGGLMSLAQAQADYMASIQTCTHTRADGSTAADYGISAENVACGYNLTIDGAIYYQWADDLHNATMVGPDTGLVGAGVATSGDNVYYALAVKRLSGEFVSRAPAQTNQQGTPAATQLQQVVIEPLVTSTMSPDGSITHIVRYGETLIQIADAYGITLTELYAANPDIDPAKPIYYEGEAIIIKLPYTPTPDVSATPTLPPPTATERPTRTATLSPTPRPTRTITFTPTATPEVFRVPDGVRTGFSIFLIAGCLAGLGVVVYLGFLRSKE
jgi:uncharacterized protein YkwD